MEIAQIMKYQGINEAQMQEAMKNYLLAGGLTAICHTNLTKLPYLISVYHEIQFYYSIFVSGQEKQKHIKHRTKKEGAQTIPSS
jgi:hypothetical protein